MPSQPPSRPPLFPRFPAGTLEPFLAARLDHHEAVMEHHAHRLEALDSLPARVERLEQRPHLSLPDGLPWTRLMGLLFLALLALSGLIAPETAARLALGAP